MEKKLTQILVIINVEYPCFTYIGPTCFCKSSTRLELTKDEFVAGVSGIGKIFYTLVRV